MNYLISRKKFDEAIKIKENKMKGLIRQFEYYNHEINCYFDDKRSIYKSLSYKEKTTSLKKFRFTNNLEYEDSLNSYIKVPKILVKDEMTKSEFRLLLFSSYLYTLNQGNIKTKKYNLVGLNSLFGVDYKLTSELMRNTLKNYERYFIRYKINRTEKKLVFSFDLEEYTKFIQEEEIEGTPDFNEIDF